MKAYIARPTYEYELTELTEPGKLCGPICGPTGVFVKKSDCDMAIAKAREEGRREGIEKAKTLFRNEHDFTGTKAWNLVSAIKTLDIAAALLGEKEEGDEVG